MIVLYHGYWINDNNECFSRCSVCKHILLWIKHDRPHEFKYCPNCGAKMDGEKEK